MNFLDIELLVAQINYTIWLEENFPRIGCAYVNVHSQFILMASHHNLCQRAVPRLSHILNTYLLYQYVMYV